MVIQSITYTFFNDIYDEVWEDISIYATSNLEGNLKAIDASKFMNYEKVVLRKTNAIQI